MHPVVPRLQTLLATEERFGQLEDPGRVEMGALRSHAASSVLSRSKSILSPFLSPPHGRGEVSKSGEWAGNLDIGDLAVDGQALPAEAHATGARSVARRRGETAEARRRRS